MTYEKERAKKKQLSSISFWQHTSIKRGFASLSFDEEINVDFHNIIRNVVLFGHSDKGK